MQVIATSLLQSKENHEAVKGWRELAVRLSVSKREMDLFAGVLDERRMNNLR